MKLTQKIWLLAGILLIPGAVSCAPSPPETVEAPAPPVASASPGSSPEAQSLNVPSSPPSDGGSQAETKTATLTVEGEPTQIELQRFDQGLPFTTYLPPDFTAEPGSSGEGTGAKFFFSPDGTKDPAAYIQVFLPSGASGLEDVTNFVTGDRGLLANNNWQVIDRAPTTEYPWAREKIVYQQTTGDPSVTGEIYIGEADGKAFYVFTHYPAEYGDGFAPRANLILENLTFQ